ACRSFNTHGPGEYYSAYRSVNCRFIDCALKGLPWVVFRGYGRTSTYLEDSVRTLANITDRFKAGEVYNIGGDQYHTIETLSDLTVEVTGADRRLVGYRAAGILTTRTKRGEVSKDTRAHCHVS